MADLLYVQQDGKLFVKSDHPHFEKVRNMIASFSTLKERQDPVLVYQVTATTLWQAAAIGHEAREVLTFLRNKSSQPVPLIVQQQIVSEMSKWGELRLVSVQAGLIQLCFSEKWHQKVWSIAEIRKLAVHDYQNRVVFPAKIHGLVKQLLAQNGLPVVDSVDYEPAAKLHAALRPATSLREYQQEAVASFFDESVHQSGVILLPCGSGKTLVGIAVLCKLGFHTLIVTPSDSAAQQWISECRRHTTIDAANIGMYQPGHGLLPVTVTTYQRVSGRNQKGVYGHLRALTSHPYGLVIYDEVHVLPAPLFRLAAGLQSSRRLGLTATLVREDGAETDVYSLIGPRCYEADWKQLEQAGYLASVECIEVRIQLSDLQREEYMKAPARLRHRIAAVNSLKTEFVGKLLQQHQTESVLIIGHYLKSLEEIATRYDLPLITGKTPTDVRNRLYEEFRQGTLNCLVLSRVANMAIDLPRASVGIQVSGLYASRQEEAQRLGRLLRPKDTVARFYSLVSAETIEVETARRRQRFLVEHGYSYETRTIHQERVIQH